MIITCEECATRFQLDDTRVPEKGVRVRCSRCQHAFFVKPTPEAGTYPVERAVSQALEEEIAAYRAPFPSDEYKAGARQFPMLVPTEPDDPAAEDNRKAWQVLMQWNKPALMCFSDSDPITGGGDRAFRKRVPGTKDQPHITLKGHHFIQEEDGETWAGAVVDWIKNGIG